MHRIVMLIVLALAPPTALAQTQQVHRCIGEHGEISFSGTRCEGATAPPNSTASSDAARTKDTCPASPDALRDVIADAFARRDANLLAGVMRWDGVGRGAATSRMRELADLTARPLLGIDIDSGYEPPPRDEAYDDPDEMPVPRARDDADGAVLVVHTGSLDGGASEHAFRLMPAGGCYWLDW